MPVRKNINAFVAANGGFTEKGQGIFGFEAGVVGGPSSTSLDVGITTEIAAPIFSPESPSPIFKGINSVLTSSLTTIGTLGNIFSNFNNFSGLTNKPFDFLPSSDVSDSPSSNGLSKIEEQRRLLEQLRQR